MSYIFPNLREIYNKCDDLDVSIFDELNKLEYEIFSDLRRQVAEFSPEIREVATKVAALDVLAGLAEIAVYQGYCRPEIADGRLIDIKDGRHPVVEALAGSHSPMKTFCALMAPPGAFSSMARMWALVAWMCLVFICSMPIRFCWPSIKRSQRAV